MLGTTPLGMGLQGLGLPTPPYSSPPPPVGAAVSTINGTPITPTRRFPPGQPLVFGCAFTDQFGTPTDCSVTFQLTDPFGVTTYPTPTPDLVRGSVVCQLTPFYPAIPFPPIQGTNPYTTASWTLRWQAYSPISADTGAIQFNVMPCLR